MKLAVWLRGSTRGGVIISSKGLKFVKKSWLFLVDLEVFLTIQLNSVDYSIFQLSGDLGGNFEVLYDF